MKHEPIDNRVLSTLGERCGALALHCSETAGFVNEVSHRIENDHSRLEELHRAVDELTSLQSESNAAAHEIRTVSQRATALISDSHQSVIAALQEIGGLIDDVVQMGDELEGFTQSIEQVASISGNLQSITRQTSILAINASIEAARAGNEASGFAAVAAEVKRLARRAGDATGSVSENIGLLEGRARLVIDNLRAGAGRARETRTRASAISHALEAIAALIIQFEQRTAAIEQCGDQVTRHVDTLGTGLEAFARTTGENLAQLGEARDQLDDLESMSNHMFNDIGHCGVETPDTRFVGLALAGAEATHTLISNAIAESRLTIDQLFDTDYQPIIGSDPIQFMTGFVAFADTHIRPLLDAETARDDRIVGCCLLDRNGFLPTHISSRSAPQRPGEPNWNLENARNRQIFMDRQTRDALDSNGDWFLYTYRQDFGNGRYRALRSVFVPLVFEGRRWGLYELGYLI